MHTRQGPHTCAANPTDPTHTRGQPAGSRCFTLCNSLTQSGARGLSNSSFLQRVPTNVYNVL